MFRPARLSRLLTLVGVLVILGGCASTPRVRRKIAQPKPEPVQVVVQPRPVPPPAAPPTASLNWLVFPGKPRDSAPLQAVYDRMMEKRTSKAVRDALCGRDEKVAVLENLESLTWLRAELARTTGLELAQDDAFSSLRSTVEVRQMVAIMGSSVTVEDALSWLAAHVVPSGYCEASGDANLRAAARDWSLATIAWATSQELVYRSAFAVFGQKWPAKSENDPWRSQKGATQALRPYIERLGSVPATETLWKATVTNQPAAPIRFGFMPTGSAETLKKLVDAKKLVDLRPSKFASPATFASGIWVAMQSTIPNRWLISETLSAEKWPDCVVAESSKDLPEVPEDETGTMTLPALLVTERCRERQTIVYRLASSHIAAVGGFSLSVEKVVQDVQFTGIQVDNDTIGWSESGTNDPAIPLDEFAEFRVSTRVEPPAERIRAAIDSVSTPVISAVLPITTVGPQPLMSLNDADVRVTGLPSKPDPVDAMSAERNSLWLRGTFNVTTRAGKVMKDQALACVQAATKSAERCVDTCLVGLVQCEAAVNPQKSPILAKSFAVKACGERNAECVNKCEESAPLCDSELPEGLVEFTRIRYLNVPVR